MCAPQNNHLLMGGGMAPDMTRFRGNISSRSNYGRSYDRQDRYRPRRGYNDRYGYRQGGYGYGDRKRLVPSGERSRSPALKRETPQHDGTRKVQDQPSEQGEAAAAVDEVGDVSGAQADDLYDPAEPTTEDTVEETEAADGQEDHDTGEGAEEDANEAGDQEGEGSVHQNEAAGRGERASTSTGIPTSKSPAKPEPKVSGSKPSDARRPTRVAEAKGQAGGQMVEKGLEKQVFRKSSQKGKGWCTVCEIHFDDSYLDHRRTEDHKIKRNEKYPKCHPCSMAFHNRKEYEHHCGSDFHCKNVEVIDNEVDESAGPLGEEYLQEVPAYYCTLCKLLMKIELKSHHCCTLGHYRRHRNTKRKEENAKKAKPSMKEREDEEDDTNQVGSDDETRAASDGADPHGVSNEPEEENLA